MEKGGGATGQVANVRFTGQKGTEEKKTSEKE
jgi:hypothetical protein